jgi:hypothetical protein
MQSTAQGREIGHGGARRSRALAQAVAARRHAPRPARRGWVRVGPASRWGPRALDRPRPRACTRHGGGPAHRRRLGLALAARSWSGRGLGRSATAAWLERFGIARTTRRGSHKSGSGGRRGGYGRGVPRRIWERGSEQMGAAEEDLGGGALGGGALRQGGCGRTGGGSEEDLGAGLRAEYGSDFVSFFFFLRKR